MIHRVVLAGLLPCGVLFLTLLSPARATDLLREVQQTTKSSQAVPVVPLQKPTRTATPEDSIFFFAGRLSTSNMGSTATFNTVAVDTTLVAPYYDNYIVGAAYQRRFRELGHGFVFGGEIGVADRFGHYAVCCTIQTETTSGVRHSGEVWFGPTIRYESFVLFNQFRIIPGMTAGFSLTTNSIGIERGRELSGNGNARFLGYLATELGALRLIGNMMEGYNANVVGVRYWF